MTNGTAPICPVSRNQPVADQPAIRAVMVPRATDLPSAIAALAQIQLALQPPQVPANNVMPPGGIKQPSSSGGGSKQAGWTEVAREMEEHRIYNQDDPSVWITLHRVTHLRFLETKTQVSLEWDLGYGQID